MFVITKLFSMILTTIGLSLGLARPIIKPNVVLSSRYRSF